MAWRIEYTATARKQLSKLGHQVARRILDFMDERAAGSADPRTTGKALKGPIIGEFWRYRVGDGESRRNSSESRKMRIFYFKFTVFWNFHEKLKTYKSAIDSIALLRAAGQQNKAVSEIRLEFLMLPFGK